MLVFRGVNGADPNNPYESWGAQIGGVPSRQVNRDSLHACGTWEISYSLWQIRYLAPAHTQGMATAQRHHKKFGGL